MCDVTSYHFLCVTQAMPGQTVTGSGTDHTAHPDVARGDVMEGEAAVPEASNPSSPSSPERACNQTPERRSRAKGRCH